MRSVFFCFKESYDTDACPLTDEADIKRPAMMIYMIPKFLIQYRKYAVGKFKGNSVNREDRVKGNLVKYSDNSSDGHSSALILLQ
jgi:hypothetical protein